MHIDKNTQRLLYIIDDQKSSEMMAFASSVGDAMMYGVELVAKWLKQSNVKRKVQAQF